MNSEHEIEICCPKCSWTPDGGPHWVCVCGHFWNTFDTAGKCPNCQKRWEDTMCPGPGDPGGCGSWSKHIDWYRNLGNKISSEIEKILDEIHVI